jgi:hypothetical protein
MIYSANRYPIFDSNRKPFGSNREHLPGREAFLSHWALDRNLTSRLTLAALKKAIEDRNPGPGLVHHSDRGPQYLHAGYLRLLHASLRRDCHASASGDRIYSCLRPQADTFARCSNRLAVTPRHGRSRRCQLATGADLAVSSLDFLQGASEKICF